MVVRLRTVEKLSSEQYRLALDVVDPERQPWDFGDCVVQIDLIDSQHQHRSIPRGLLKPAFEIYKLAPEEPPQLVEARLFWEIGKVVYQYVDHLFKGGVFCPFAEQPREEAPEVQR